MNRMASMRKSLYSGARSALSFCKSTSSSSSSSSRYGAPVAGGSIAANCTPVSQTCGPKVSGSAIRKACSPSRVSPTSTPFSTKSNISGSIPGSRCYASQIARLPGELGATLSLIPYYSALADSRLVSRIGASGDAAILQGERIVQSSCDRPLWSRIWPMVSSIVMVGVVMIGFGVVLARSMMSSSRVLNLNQEFGLWNTPLGGIQDGIAINS